ncbi:hypothetical protein M407DRAFT_28547 [Tulasnella calospora MUT 4182]|uniref:Uncharacterized protein n=1 Tax=Tulasnella calospora MUT 4182 TaxID=1051891 RepID=A0A0C3KKJ1_9AGAM|nr:hypothetical protein M407DRAFT_28547 [Tulasnella calospora MUT 4182]
MHKLKNWLKHDQPITNIYDSELYYKLQESPIEVNGHILPEHYFEDPQDVLLTSLTGGFQLFRQGKHTAWPLLFINNDLSHLNATRSAIASVLALFLVLANREIMTASFTSTLVLSKSKGNLPHPDMAIYLETLNSVLHPPIADISSNDRLPPKVPWLT